MKHNCLGGVVLMVFALCPPIAFSNVAEPEARRPRVNQEVPLKITADGGTTENRLVIPRKFLENAGMAGADSSGNPGADLRTLIAGLAMSVSVVSLVFLVIRKKSRVAQAIALLVGMGTCGWIWVEQANADIPPPRADVVRNWRQVAEGQRNVKIEIVEKGDAVELILGTYRKRNEPPRETSVPPDLNRPKETGSAPKAEPESEPPAPKSEPLPKPE